MMEFIEEMVVTGVEKRVSQKTGKEYTVINYLDEKGQTFGTVADCVVPSSIKQLDRATVSFKVFPGRYLQLKTMTIEVI